MPGTAHPSALARALRAGRTYPPPRASGDVPAVVRGADVASLVRSAQAQTATGLRVRGVTVTGQLDLSHTEVPFPVTFEECAFEEPVRLDGAHLSGVAVAPRGAREQALRGQCRPGTCRGCDGSGPRRRASNDGGTPCRSPRPEGPRARRSPRTA